MKEGQTLYLRHLITNCIFYDDENCLKPIDDFYGSESLAYWLKNGFGDVLKNCMSEENQLEITSRNMVAILLVLNEVIPQMPETMSFLDFTPTVDTPRQQNSSTSIDELISSILQELISLFINVVDDCDPKWMPLIGSILIRSVFHASEKTILTHCYIGDLLHSLETNVHYFCNDISHIFIGCIISLSSKSVVLRDLISVGSILKARLIVKRNCVTNCPAVEKLRDWYEDNQIENQLTNISTWSALIETSRWFEENRIYSALMLLSNLLDQGDWCEQDWLQSGVLNQLGKFLRNESRENENTRHFLIVLLRFEVNEQNEYKWDRNRFISFIEMCRTVLDYSARSVISFINSRNDSSSSKQDCEKHEMNNISLILNMLQILYKLNFTWCQFLDLANEDSIISENELGFLFVSKQFSYLLECHNDFCSWDLLEFATICPAASTLISRRTILTAFYKPTRYYRYKHIIPRANVLSTVMYRYNNYDVDALINMNFCFQNEIATGLGPSKEVFTLVSKELQRHEFGLWDGIPVTVSNDDNNVHTHCPTGLYPKSIPNNLSFFHFIGKLLAVVFFKGYQLDLPLSEDFFKDLQFPDPNKSYNSIFRAFPMTKYLVDRLISIKRQIRMIKSYPILTQPQKQNIIDNVPFDGVSSFEDLNLNFTLPGTDIELIPGGFDVLLSTNNIDEYLGLLTQRAAKLYPSEQFKAIREGVDDIFPNLLELFTAKELKDFICGEAHDKWSLEDLQTSCRFDEHYSLESKPVYYLFQVLMSFDNSERRMFLEFVTSVPTLPFGGLTECRLTIIRMASDDPDNTLPCASTCFNTLFLPEYSSYEAAKKKLLYAMIEGKNSFQLR